MLTFVKLGGSLITNKNQASSARYASISRLVQEIKQALQADPDLQLILGHGSGSFGHTAAKEYQTHLGVKSTQEWHGFINVRRQADVLHRIIMDKLWNAGLDAISFPPSALAITNDHTKVNMAIAPMVHSLDHHLIPVVLGDVVFDTKMGGTILSTEEIIAFLCSHLPIQRILIAGIEKGVWKDEKYPQEIFSVLTPQIFAKHFMEISPSSSPDVTGGMRSKVEILFSVLKCHPNIQVSIFSGEVKGNLYNALTGKTTGTVLKISD